MKSPLTTRQHASAVLALGLPLIGSHLAQFAINVTDAIMLGWYSVESLAAVVLGGSFFFTTFFVGSGFAWAVMPMVASAAASGQDAQVRRVTRMAMWLSLAFGLAVMPMFLFSEPLLLAIGQDPAISALAADYLKVFGWGILPALQVMVLKSYLSGLERTKVLLFITVAGAVLNAVLNYALIFGNWGAPEMGIRGAAIASVILNLVSLAALAAYAA